MSSPKELQAIIEVLTEHQADPVTVENIKKATAIDELVGYSNDIAAFYKERAAYLQMTPVQRVRDLFAILSFYMGADDKGLTIRILMENKEPFKMDIGMGVLFSQGIHPHILEIVGQWDEESRIKNFPLYKPYMEKNVRYEMFRMIDYSKFSHEAVLREAVITENSILRSMLEMNNDFAELQKFSSVNFTEFQKFITIFWRLVEAIEPASMAARVLNDAAILVLQRDDSTGKKVEVMECRKDKVLAELEKYIAATYREGRFMMREDYNQAIADIAVKLAGIDREKAHLFIKDFADETHNHQVRKKKYGYSTVSVRRVKAIISTLNKAAPDPALVRFQIPKVTKKQMEQLQHLPFLMQISNENRKLLG